MVGVVTTTVAVQPSTPIRWSSPAVLITLKSSRFVNTGASNASSVNTASVISPASASRLWRIR